MNVFMVFPECEIVSIFTIKHVVPVSQYNASGKEDRNIRRSRNKGTLLIGFIVDTSLEM
jgi:hypothetical protein